MKKYKTYSLVPSEKTVDMYHLYRFDGLHREYVAKHYFESREKAQKWLDNLNQGPLV